MLKKTISDAFEWLNSGSLTSGSDIFEVAGKRWSSETTASNKSVMNKYDLYISPIYSNYIPWCHTGVRWGARLRMHQPSDPS